MNDKISESALDQIFIKARTHKAWLDKPVSDEMLERIYHVMKWGPTSNNCCPLRISFVKSKEAKERLIGCLSKGNIEKVRAAPVTAILAQDTEFYKAMSKLVPHDPKSGDVFKTNESLRDSTAFRNSSLQGAYFIIAARALGFDCGPMSGFDNAKVDKEFFEGMSWKSNFICNIGYGDAGKLFPRAPRLDFDEACEVL